MESEFESKVEGDPTPQLHQASPPGIPPLSSVVTGEPSSEDLGTRNVADLGYLPPYPLPILGPMSNIQDRVEPGNVEYIDVYQIPRKNDAGISGNKEDNQGDPNNNLGIDNPIYASSDDISS